MFTRTNLILTIVLFLIFFIFFTLLLGERGIIAQREVENRRVAASSEVERKQAEVNILRKHGNNNGSGEKEELIYAMQNKPFSPEVTRALAVNEFKPWSRIRIIAISMIPSILYLSICLVVNKKRGRL